MGLSSSKVTRVAPGPALGALPGEPGQPSPQSPAGTPWGKPIFHLELPPLRETWYGRGSAGPLSLNTLPGKDGASIIKQHPPRRPQRLEPAIPPHTITPAQPWSQRAVAAGTKPKVLEKRGQSLNPLPGRRQHLHKLQMLDLTRKRREAELKRNLHREAKINKQKIKEFSPQDVLESPQRADSTRSPGPVPAEHSQRFHEDDPGISSAMAWMCQRNEAQLWRGWNPPRGWAEVGDRAVEFLWKGHLETRSSLMWGE